MKKVLSILALLSAVLVVNNVSAQMGRDCASQNAFFCSKIGHSVECVPNVKKVSNLPNSVKKAILHAGYPNQPDMNSHIGFDNNDICTLKAWCAGANIKGCAVGMTWCNNTKSCISSDQASTMDCG